MVKERSLNKKSMTFSLGVYGVHVLFIFYT